MVEFSEKEVSELYEWYSNLENRFRIIADIIPFTDREDLRKFSSPRLVPLLVEAAAIIDSILRSLFPDKAQRPKGNVITKRGANINDYYRILEEGLRLSQTSSLVLASPPFILVPFLKWSDTKPPRWWTAYNRLKHDRIKWSKEATMLNTMSALCGLQQLMTKIPSVRIYMLRFGWLDSPGISPDLLVEVIEDQADDDEVFYAYTQLFCTPLKPILWKSFSDIKIFGFGNWQRLQLFLAPYRSEIGVESST